MKPNHKAAKAWAIKTQQMESVLPGAKNIATCYIELGERHERLREKAISVCRSYPYGISVVDLRVELEKGYD